MWEINKIQLNFKIEKIMSFKLLFHFKTFEVTIKFKMIFVYFYFHLILPPKIYEFENE